MAGQCILPTRVITSSFISICEISLGEYIFLGLFLDMRRHEPPSRQPWCGTGLVHGRKRAREKEEKREREKEGEEQAEERGRSRRKK